MKLHDHIDDEMHTTMEQYAQYAALQQSRIEWVHTCVDLKAENMQMHSFLCVFVANTNHTPLTQRVDRALGAMVDPCCMKPPTGNQKLLPSEY